MSAQDRDWFPHINPLTGDVEQKIAPKMGENYFREGQLPVATATKNAAPPAARKLKVKTPYAHAVWLASIALFILGMFFGSEKVDSLGTHMQEVSIYIWLLSMVMWRVEKSARRSKAGRVLTATL